MYQKVVVPTMQLNSAIKEVRGLPLSEQQQMLTAATPVPGEGFLAAQQRQAILANAIQLDQKLREASPAAYVIDRSPGVKKAYEETLRAEQSKDPNAVKYAYSVYADTVLAEQDRLGMPRALMTNQQAQSVVAKFYDQKEGGQNAAQLIKGLSEQWGKNWNQIYAQISKDIPSAARTIGAGMQDVPAALLASVADVEPKKLKESLSSDVAKDIGTYLDKHFEQGRLSLLATNPRSGSQVLASTYSDTEKLALVYALKGKSGKEAAEQAYNDTFGHRYEFVRSGPAVYRVPKTQEVSAITSGARVVLNSVDDMALELPRSALNPDQTKAAWTQTLKAQAYWVTAPNEDGLMLYHANNGAVLDAMGKPVWRSWFALEQAGKAGTTNPQVQQAPKRSFESSGGGAAVGSAKPRPAPTLGKTY
jgi:hypothetical protein